MSCTSQRADGSIHMRALTRPKRFIFGPQPFPALWHSWATAPIKVREEERSSMPFPNLLGRMMKLQQEEEVRVSEIAPRRIFNSERAVKNWRVVMEKVADLMELARVQAKLNTWQEDGLASGCQSQLPPGAAHPHLVHAFPSGNQSRESHMKEEIYVELVKMGTPLGLRKSKEGARVMPHCCTHPAAALAGAGNQVQREIWCRDCHSRWLVNPEVMNQIQAKAQVIQYNGKVFTFSNQVPMTSKSNKVKPSAKHSPRSPTMKLRSPISYSKSTGEATPVKSPYKVKETAAPHCMCGKPATQLIVKKDGPTQGRLFWKCTERVCQYFEWDQEEVKMLQRKALQEKEDAEMIKAEKEAQEEREWMVQQTMAAAEERHSLLMNEEKVRHQQEMEQMKNQLFWLAAVAGDEKMEEMCNNPMLQQQTMMKALELRRQMTEEEMQAANKDPGTSSGMWRTHSHSRRWMNGSSSTPLGPAFWRQPSSGISGQSGRLRRGRSTHTYVRWHNNFGSVIPPWMFGIFTTAFSPILTTSSSLKQ